MVYLLSVSYTHLLFWAKKHFSRVEAVCFTYGQKHSLEIEVARKIAADADVPFQLLDVSLISQLDPNCSLTNASIEMDQEKPEDSYPNTFVPGRNMVFLTFAAILARGKGIYQMCIRDSYRSEDSNEINLMTLHKSKGLEFDAVIHADLYEWGLPSKKVENNNFKEPLYPNWEQDLNLHYVGITRAKKVCILIRSEKRHKSNGELTNAQDSEFIQLHNVHNLRFNPVNAIPFPTQRYMNEVKEKEFPRS